MLKLFGNLLKTSKLFYLFYIRLSFIRTASSASSPPSTSHKRQLSLTSPAQLREVQVRRRLMICNSDPSSSDDGIAPIVHHRVASGIQTIHNQTMAGLFSEAIEMKAIGMNALPMQHRKAQYEDSVKTTSTFSSKSFSSNHDTAETNLSLKTARSLDKDETCYKRSRSYHGKTSKGLSKVWCLAVVTKLVTGSFSLFAYSKYSVLSLDVQLTCIAHVRKTVVKLEIL